MKIKILPFALLLSSLLLMSSCLKTDDEDTLLFQEDTAIATFALNDLKRDIHVKSSTGEDSVVVEQVKASMFPMFIDQAKREIYNQDSLPYGTRVDRVLCAVNTVGHGRVLVNLKKKDLSDSLIVLTGRHSLDFTKPVEFRVYQPKDDNYRSYMVKVNVHKEMPNVMHWTSLPWNQNFVDFSAMRSFALNDKVFVFGKRIGQMEIYGLPIEGGQSWTLVNKQFSAGAVDNVVQSAAKMFVLDEGKLYSSEDASAWTEIGECKMTRLVGCDGEAIYALSADGKLMISTDGRNWQEETLDSDADLLPTENVQVLSKEIPGQGRQLLLMGYRSKKKYPNDKAITIWAKIIGGNTDRWFYYTPESYISRLPDMEQLMAVNYGGRILAVGQQSEAQKCFYESFDSGITWKKSEVLTFPDNYTSVQEIFAFTSDKRNCLWLIGSKNRQVWTGRLNQLGWKNPSLK